MEKTRDISLEKANRNKTQEAGSGVLGNPQGKEGEKTPIKGAGKPGVKFSHVPPTKERGERDRPG